MNEKQLLQKHQENVESFTEQHDAESAGTNRGNWLVPAPVEEEKIVISELEQPLYKHEQNLDSITSQGDALPVGTGMGNGLAKVAIAGVVGAVLGTVAAGLTGKVTAQKIKDSVKGLGDAVKGVTKGVKHTVKDTVDALNTVDDAKSSVDTVDAKNTVEDAKSSDNQTFKLYEERLVANTRQIKTAEVSIGKHIETQTAYISVPLQKERVVVERIIPVDVGTSVELGEVNFYEGELVRINVYEETPNVHKQAFVREEVSIRKEVEQVSVEVEDKIRREELDLDYQDSNVAAETKTL